MRNKLAKIILIALTTVFSGYAFSACYYDLRWEGGYPVSNMGIVRSGWSGLLPSETWKIKGLEVGSYAFANTSTPNTHTVDGVTFWRGAKRAQGSYNAGAPSYYEAWEICTNYQFRLDLPIQSYFEDNAYVDINNNNAYVGGVFFII